MNLNCKIDSENKYIFHGNNRYDNRQNYQFDGIRQNKFETRLETDPILRNCLKLF